MPARTQLFGEPEPLRAPTFASAMERRELSWKAIGVIAAVIVFLFVLWFSRERWMPRPALELRTAEINGTFSFEWNRAAVRGVTSGMLRIADGTTSRTIYLGREQLEAGTLPYARQSPDVSGELVAGESRAQARFIAPPPPVLPKLPADDATTPAAKRTPPARPAPRPATPR